MHVVTDIDDLHRTVDAYASVEEFCFDVETWGVGDDRLNPRKNSVVWIALSTTGRVDVIPMGHPNGELLREEFPLLKSAAYRIERNLPLRESDYSKDRRKVIKHFSEPPPQCTPAEVFGALKKIMFSDSRKVGHNLKFDLESVSKYLGGIPSGPYGDTLTATFLIDNRHRVGLGLRECLFREFKYEMEKGIGAEIENYTFDEVAKYAYLDAKWTWLLWQKIKSRLDSDRLWSVFDLEMDVLGVITKMEMHGADIDTEALGELKTSLENDLEETKGRIYSLAGRAFNLNSVAEKQRLLFGSKKEGGRGLRGSTLTPKGKERRTAKEPRTVADYSVAADALESLRGKDDLVNALLEYADTMKLLSTYVIPYTGGEITRTTLGKEKITKKESLLVNGRVHTDFVQWGAETGRFSSRNPNLQNIPAPKTDRGRRIRNLFVAPEGHSLIVADYSQIEPRVIASFTEDETMLDTYTTGADLYTAIGDKMGVTRSVGKTLVLAMSYGVGPDKIASSIGCSVDEARDLLGEFESRFPAVSEYRYKLISNARKRKPVPYVATLLGRRRYLPDLNSRQTSERARAERQAFNTRIQGSAADIIKLAMVRADYLLPEGAHLILTVHDELVTSAPDQIVEETAQAIREAMEGINTLKVPLLAEMAVVRKWGDAK